MSAPTVLSFSSQVVYGHVGNSAIAPALQAMGCEVLAVPTVLLAHHPGHGPARGRGTPPEELDALVEGLAQVGALGACRAVLSGYLGQPESAPVVAQAVQRVRACGVRVPFLCDPVIGDDGRVYVREGVEAAIAQWLLPLADVLTPNHFELERLAGAPVATLAQAVSAARSLIARGPHTVVVTSLRHDALAPGELANLAVTAQGAWITTTARLDAVPRGSGDLIAALLMAHLLAAQPLPRALGLATSSVQAVLAASVGRPEMALIERQASLRDPVMPQVRALEHR